jgi:sorting nexin-9/18/33
LSKSPLSPATVSLASPKVALANAAGARPLSGFDAGLNSSAAWTEHLERDGHSLSDEDPEDDGEENDQPGRPARALYAFEGKPEFREISAAAGDELEVLKEELQDGWSLVRRGREVGLLPKTYYIVSSRSFGL